MHQIVREICTVTRSGVWSIHRSRQQGDLHLDLPASGAPALGKALYNMTITLPPVEMEVVYTQGYVVTCILDIDLDYFNLSPDPAEELRTLLAWAGRPVDLIVEQHHHAFYWWERIITKKGLATPSTVIHVDEHHDLLNDAPRINAANFMVTVMQQWPTCEVLWVMPEPIDWPDLWLEEETWELISSRFRWVAVLPDDAPVPDLITICTSPGFLPDGLTQRLLAIIHQMGGPRRVQRRVIRQLASTVPR